MRKQGKGGIEWCDYTWNPVSGCLNSCEYCYARRIARRFGKINDGYHLALPPHIKSRRNGEVFELSERLKNPYPFGFRPTLRRYLLDEPRMKKTPSTIFVGSMCDLFGAWIPFDWVESVLDACEAAPRHRYMFLIKNIHGYFDFDMPSDFKNCWYGQSWDGINTALTYYSPNFNRFLSIEPLLRGNLALDTIAEGWFDWVIVGAETGNRRGKVTPRREWVASIVTQCWEVGVPVFLKSNLAEVWGGELIQEFPFKADFNKTRRLQINEFLRRTENTTSKRS